MGIVYADLVLKNVKDLLRAEDGLISESEIRQKTVKAIVDTGAMSMVINEELCNALGLSITGEKGITLANNAKDVAKITGPVEIHWKNRSFVCPTLVSSANGPILMGVIPLEGMDLMVDPVRLELVGAHGEEEVYRL